MEEITGNSLQGCDGGASIGQRLSNEWQAFSKGAALTPQALEGAVSHAWHNPGETSIKVGTAAVFGFAIGFCAKSPGKLGTVAKGIGAAAGVAFLADGLRPTIDAAKVAWYAGGEAEVNRAAQIWAAGNSRFLVDTVIATPGGVLGAYGGGKLNARIFGESKPAAAVCASSDEVTATATALEQPKSEMNLVSIAKPSTPESAIGKPALMEITATAPQTKREPLPINGSLTSADGGTLGTVRITSAKPVIELPVAVAPKPSAKADVAPLVAEAKPTRVAQEAPLARYVAEAKAKVAATESEGSRLFQQFLKGEKLTFHIQDVSQVPAGRVDIGIGTGALSGKNASAQTAKGLSIADAATMPVPGGNVRIAMKDPADGESLIALALLTNRADKRPVNSSLLEMILRQDANTKGHNKVQQRYRAIGGIIADGTLAPLKKVHHISKMLEGRMDGQISQFNQNGVQPIIRGRLDGNRWEGVRQSLEAEGTLGSQSGKTGAAERAVASGANASRADVTDVATPKTTEKPAVKSDYEVGIATYSTADRFDLLVGVRLQTGKPSLEVGKSVQQALSMPAAELPANGARIGVVSQGPDAILAAAILKNRVSGKPVDLNVVNTLTGRDTPVDGSGQAALADAFSGLIAKGPTLQQKIKNVSAMLGGTLSKDRITEFCSWNRSIGPKPGKASATAFYDTPMEPAAYDFIALKGSKEKFDFGVEVTNPKLLNGQRNLDHHGHGASAKMPSAAEQALELPVSELPKPGSVVATVTPDADSVTSMAVLGNRAVGKTVNPTLVNAIGRKDRGFAEFAAGEETPRLRTMFNSIRSISRNQRIPLQQRVQLVGMILAEEAPMAPLKRISDGYQKGVQERLDRAANSSQVEDLIPGKLTLVLSDTRNFAYEARQLGQQTAPVTLVSDTGHRYYTICARPDAPEARYMSRALAKLNEVDPGWVGRDELFLAKNSRLKQEQVVQILRDYVEPKPETRLAWDMQDMVTRFAPDLMPPSRIPATVEPPPYSVRYTPEIPLAPRIPGAPSRLSVVLAALRQAGHLNPDRALNSMRYQFALAVSNN